MPGSTICNMTTVKIITGFLGAGKTTTLNNILKTIPEERNVAVVVNEFAVIGVDGKMLTQDGVEIKQLSNGCVCCTKKTELRETLRHLMKNYDPELILIETSGVASIEPLLQTVKDVGASFGGIITVVDSKRFADSSGFGKIAKKQIMLSSLVVINKIDLVSDTLLEYLGHSVHRLNPIAKMMLSEQGSLYFSDIDELPSVALPQPRTSAFKTMLGTLFPAWALDDSSKHIKKSGVNSVSYETTQPLDRNKFDKFIDNLPRSIYRAKGFVHFLGDEQPYRFQYASGMIAIEEDETENSQIVLIGKMSFLDRLRWISKLKQLHASDKKADIENAARLLR